MNRTLPFTLTPSYSLAFLRSHYTFFYHIHVNSPAISFRLII